MIVSLEDLRNRVQPAGHYCPVCLRRVQAGEAERKVHQEACRSGALEMELLHCPTCGLVLAAELEHSQAASAQQTAA